MSQILIDAIEALLSQLENEHLSEFSEEPIENLTKELQKFKDDLNVNPNT